MLGELIWHVNRCHILQINIYILHYIVYSD